MHRVIEPFASVGSGSMTAIPTIKRWVQHYDKPYRLPCTSIEDMPIKAGIECLTFAHLEAAEQTSTVSPDFEINLMTLNRDGIKKSNMSSLSLEDQLPLVKMRRELLQDKAYFLAKRNSPNLIEQLLSQQSEL